MYNSGFEELNEMFSSSDGTEVGLAFLGMFLIFFIVIALIAAAFNIVARWIFFKKCGEEGWKSLIPFYTDYTVIKIAGLNWWWILILFAGSILSGMKSSINTTASLNDSAALSAFASIVAIFSIFASIAALLARINYSYNITKRFEKNAGYAVLLVLFEPIMFLILGLSKNDKYNPSIEVSPNGIFGGKPQSEAAYCPDCGTKVKDAYCSNCGKKVR